MTIDGQGQTTIEGGAAGTPLTIRGGNITVKNLRVTGGRNGISVHRRGSATIDSVLVEGVGNNGIVIIQGSFGRIVNSIIQNSINGCAIVVSDNSAARIGFLTAANAAASPNVLQGNDDGVCVSSSSYAEVVGNNINGNTNHGVFVNTVSHADISSNAIDNNGGQGVQVGRNSGVNLGRDTGIGLFEAPNTTTANNGQFGVRCFINSYVDGRLGTLNGAAGQTDFGSGCINSTLP